MVALEWSLHGVRLHVPLQITRSSASIVALFTFERLFFSVLSHDVDFQMIILNARNLACCASVWLFCNVRLLVPPKVACNCCFIFTLVANVHLLTSVVHDMYSEDGSMVA